MTSAIANGNDGLSINRPSVYDVEAQYEKILRLRDDIFADKHPKLKPLKQVTPDSKPSVPTPSLVNGVHKPASIVSIPAQNSATRVHPFQSVAPTPKSSAVLSRQNAVSGSSGIDPIFLKKSDVLVRAEIQQKRQRIERTLDEQLIQKRVHARQNVLDEYALPDFNVTEVLRKAQEIVKPVKVLVQNTADRIASSSDSFDENTFYSSQMDSLSEGTDPPAKKAVEAEGREGMSPQPMDIDSGDADELASSRSQKRTSDFTLEKDPFPKGPMSQGPTSQGPTSQGPMSQQEQIARLEEEIRRLQGQVHRKTPPNAQENEIPDEPPYSPPDVRASPQVHPNANPTYTSIAQHNQRQAQPRRSSKALEPQAREFLRHAEAAASPVSSDVRIVRNHITSPLAPQPARVSPLAVAKEPPLSQVRNNRQQNGDGLAGLEAGSNRRSPNQPVQTINSRKRRRGTNSGEAARNVAARREAASPEIRIKPEPISPQPHPAALGAWRPPRREEVHRPVVVDTASPRQAPVERIVQQPQRSERQEPMYAIDQGRPLTPNGYGSGRYVEVREDPDPRRVVSARKVRAPMSPGAQYFGAQPSSARAASQVFLPQSTYDTRQNRSSSQVYMPQVSQDLGRQQRAPIPPLSLSAYVPQSPSPLPHQIQRPSPRQGSVAMAPPPRRIVVDQYGNRFVEAPAPALSERHVSAVPVPRPSEYEPRYEPPMRAPITRQPSTDVVCSDPRYVQRPPSPASPRYIEYPPQAPPGRAGSMVYLDNDRHHERAAPAPRRTDSGMVHYIDYPPTARLEEVSRPREVVRMSSVRPVGNPYEIPRDQLSRVPSVRPEQARIVNLSGRRDDVSQDSRHVSIRPEAIYTRPSGAALEERPQYQYVPEPQGPRYVTSGSYDDGLVFEAPGSAGRRIVQ